MSWNLVEDAVECGLCGMLFMILIKYVLDVFSGVFEGASESGIFTSIIQLRAPRGYIAAGVGSQAFAWPQLYGSGRMR